jgi:hypothetical protein
MTNLNQDIQLHSQVPNQYSGSVRRIDMDSSGVTRQYHINCSTTHATASDF